MVRLIDAPPNDEEVSLLHLFAGFFFAGSGGARRAGAWSSLVAAVALVYAAFISL